MLSANFSPTKIILTQNNYIVTQDTNFIAPPSISIDLSLIFHRIEEGYKIDTAYNDKVRINLKIAIY